MLKRIIALVLLLTSTGGVLHQTDLMSKRAFFAKKVVSEQSSDNRESVTQEYYSTIKQFALEAENATHTEFADSAESFFEELYAIVKNADGSINSFDSLEKRFVSALDGLFSLDSRLYESNPEMLGELTNNGFVTKSISLVWKLVTDYDTKRVDSQTMTPGVTRLEDIPYIDDGTNEHKLDIFYPEKTDKALPVIIDIHGGGLLMGDKDSNRVYCSVLADRGYTVIALNYRLAPDVLYPSMVQDIMTAFKWIYDNADKYYCDLDNVFVTGDSAGGQLAYYVPLVNSSEFLCKLYGVEASGLDIRALGLVSGMYDMKNGFNGPLISCFFGFDYKNSPYYNYIQPEEALPLGKLPPAYFVTCQRDFLHASGVYFDRVLTEMGIEHQFHDWGLTFNRSSGHITSVAFPELEESRQTIDEMLAFFDSHRAS